MTSARVVFPRTNNFVTRSRVIGCGGGDAETLKNANETVAIVISQQNRRCLKVFTGKAGCAAGTVDATETTTQQGVV